MISDIITVAVILLCPMVYFVSPISAFTSSSPMHARLIEKSQRCVAVSTAKASSSAVPTSTSAGTQALHNSITTCHQHQQHQHRNFPSQLFASKEPTDKDAHDDDDNDDAKQKEQHEQAMLKALKAMTAFSNKYIENTQTYYCSDLSIPAVVIKGLAEHKVQLGAPLCPCRFYEDKEKEAKDGYWNCPCVPMRERHECHCMLFLTEENDFAGKETVVTVEQVQKLSEGFAS